MKKKNYAAMAVALVTGGLAARAQAGLYNPANSVQNGTFDYDLNVATPSYSYNQALTGWYHVTGGNNWQSQAQAAVGNAPNQAYGVLSGDGTNPGELFQSIGTFSSNYNVSISLLEAYITGQTGQSVTVSLYSGGTASTTYQNGYGAGYSTNNLVGATLLGSQTIADTGSNSFSSSSFVINTGTAGTKGATLWLDIASSTNDSLTQFAIDSVVASGASTYNAISWTGSVNSNWDSSTANFSNASGGVAYSDNLDVVFGNVAAGKSSINLIGTVMPQSITFNNTSGTYTISGAGSIAGGTSLTKNGAGTMILNTSNTFTGPVAINAGAVILQNGAGLGTSQNVNVSSGATLAFQISGGATVNNATIINGAGVAGEGALLNLSGTNTLNGNVVVASNSTINVASGSLTLIGSMYGTGGLTVTGAGTLYYNALNNMAGDTTVAGGHIMTDWEDSFVGTNLNVSGGGSVVVFGNGGGAIKSTNVNINGGSITAGAGSSLQNGTVNVNSGGVLTLTYSFADEDAVLNINSGGVVNVSGGDAIGYGGAGYQVFNVNITGGTFNIADSQNEGYDTQWNLTGGSITSTGGGYLNIDSASGYTITSLSSGTTSIISAPIGIRSGTLDFVVAQGATANGIDLNVSGTIGQTPGQGGADQGIQKDGEGTLALTGAGTFTGGVTVNAGTLMLGDGTSGHDGSLNSSNQISLNGDSNIVFNTAVLQNFANQISGSGPTNSLTKTGPGTLYLSGSLSYSGTTNVSAGKLYLDGQLVNTSAVNVLSGATLGGLGNIGAPVTLAPGASIEGGQNGSGQLTVQSLSLNGADKLVIGSLSPYASSAAISTGGLSFNGSAITVTVGSVAGAVANTPYQLISFSSESGSTPSYTLSLPRGAVGQVSTVGSSIDLTLSMVGGAYALVWSGTNGTAWNTTTANWKLNGTGSAITYIDNPGDPVVFNDAPGSNQTIAINNGDVHPASVAFNNSTYSYTVTGSNAIAGNTAISLNGTGKVTLSNTNSFTGGITINSGTLSVANDASLGVSTGSVTLNGGTLQLSAPVTLGSSRAIVAGTNGGTIDADGNSVTIPGVISGSGTAGGIILNSSGGSVTVALTATQNTDTGPLTLDSGVTLALGKPGGLYLSSSEDFSTIYVNSGAVLETVSTHVFGYGSSVRPNLVVNGGTIKDLGTDNYLGMTTLTGGTITGTGDYRFQNLIGSSADTVVTLPSSVTSVVSTPTLELVSYGGSSPLDANPVNFNISKGMTSTGVDFQINSVLGSGAQLVKNGNGTMLLAASNTYYGGTTVNAGLLIANQGLAGLGNQSASSTVILGGNPYTFYPIINVNGGAIILRNASFGAVYSELQTGYNGGSWNLGSGLSQTQNAISSTAAGLDPGLIHGVGMLQATRTIIFEGQTLNPGDIALKYTYYGDTNLDGKVDGSDYSTIDNSYNMEHFVNGVPSTSISGWQYGDFNYDGVVDGSDYTLMDNAFNQQGAVLSSQIATTAAQISGGTSAVPEPATISLLGASALGMLARRKRR
jgi:autotransporter-associated beta strand protein